MKKLFSVLLSAITMLSLCFAFAACSENTQSKIESGNFVAEGVFEKGVTLSATRIGITDAGYSAILEKVADKEYDKEKVVVYDISLVKDNAKVQPEGKVKITMPAPFTTENSYVTYHIKDETVEELGTEFSDGRISFETASFSYFVVAGKPGGSVIVPDGGGLTPNDPTKNFFAYVDGFEQGTMTANGIDVPKGGYAASLKEGDTVELVARAKDGYEMIGWYKNEKNSAVDEKYDERNNPATFTYRGTENMYVYARFDVIDYAITVNLNGGELNEGENIPATYNVETETIILPTPKKGTTEFLGWTDGGGNAITEIVKGSTGDISLEAQWESATYIRVDKNKSPDENGEYILFGSYPQTQVSKYDTSTITALNEKAGEKPTDGNNGKWTSYRYYYAKLLDDGSTEACNDIDFMWYIDVSYMGVRYRGVYFDKYRPAAAKGNYNILKDGKNEQVICSQTKNSYYVDNVYWFRYEPILWKILGEEDGKARLLCMTALDSQPYALLVDHSSEWLYDKERDTKYHLCYNTSPGVPNGVLGTDYEHSWVRDWLNGYFYDNAFSSSEKTIVCDTVVDNVTGEVGRNTTEKVFISSINEVKDAGDLDRKASDYAKSQGTEMQYGGTYSFSWYLRDTYYVLRFNDEKDLISYDKDRYYQLCSAKGGAIYNSNGVPRFTGAGDTTNAVVPSLRIAL